MSTCECGIELQTGLAGTKLCPACLLQLGLGASHDFDEPPETPSLPRLVALVGQGPRGMVYLGHRGGPPIAFVTVKFVDLIVDAERLVSELQQMAGRLRPPIEGVAQLLDCGVSSDGRVYVVSQYVPGPDIGLYLRSRRPGISERLRLIADICSTVSQLHRRNVVHGGLKTTNVVVTGSSTRSRPVLLDTGVRPAIERSAIPSHSSAGGETGTKPQRPDGSERDDVRSLYALAQELLTDAGNDRLRALRAQFLDQQRSYSTASELALDITALGAHYAASS